MSKGIEAGKNEETNDRKSLCAINRIGEEGKTAKRNMCDVYYYYYSHAVKRTASTINSSRSIVISVKSSNRTVNQNHIVVFIATTTHLSSSCTCGTCAVPQHLVDPRE